MFELLYEYVYMGYKRIQNTDDTSTKKEFTNNFFNPKFKRIKNHMMMNHDTLKYSIYLFKLRS